jgi:uncharacterized protein YegP (UPF0339 family)
MKIVIKRNGWLRQKWHFCIVAQNGRTLASSGNYYNLVDCESAISTILTEIGESHTEWPVKNDGIHPDPPPHKP